jgi:hypothetical protein
LGNQLCIGIQPSSLHWNNSLRVDMSPHSDTLSWFRVNQSLLFLLNAACATKKQQITNLWAKNTTQYAWDTTKLIFFFFCRLRSRNSGDIRVGCRRHQQKQKEKEGNLFLGQREDNSRHSKNILFLQLPEN